MSMDSSVSSGVFSLLSREAVVRLSPLAVSVSYLPVRCELCGRYTLAGHLPQHYSAAHFRRELDSLPAAALDSCPECPYSGDELGLHLGSVHGAYKPFLQRVSSCGVRVDRRPFMEHAASCVVRMDKSAVQRYLDKRERTSSEQAELASPSSVLMEEKEDVLHIPCLLCSQPFSNLSLLLAHLVQELKSAFEIGPSLHEEGATRICHECGAAVASDSLLEHHGVLHQAVLRPYVLEVNNKSRERFFTLARGVYACNLCSSSFTTEMRVLNHIMESHDPLIASPLTCQLCSKRIKSNFILHLMEVHFKEELSGILPDEPPYSCYVCQTACKSQKELAHHFLYIHNMALNLYNNAVQSKKLQSREMVHRCWLCLQDGVFYNQVDTLRKHLIEEHLLGQLKESVMRERKNGGGASNPKACPNCNFLAEEEESLIHHILYSHTQYLDRLLRRLDAEAMLDSVPISEGVPSQSKLVRERLMALVEKEEEPAHEKMSLQEEEETPIEEEDAPMQEEEEAPIQEEENPMEEEEEEAPLREEEPHLAPILPQIYAEVEPLGMTDAHSTMDLLPGSEEIIVHTSDMEISQEETRQSVLHDLNNLKAPHSDMRDVRIKRMDFERIMIRYPSCHKCLIDFPKVTPLQIHLCKVHYFNELERDLSSMLKRASSKICPLCKRTSNSYEALIYHFGVKHKKVMTLYYRWVLANPECFTKYLNTSLLDEGSSNKENKSLKIPGSSFRGGNPQEFSKISSIMQIYLNQEDNNSSTSFIQPGACFYISSSLSHCHECENYVQSPMKEAFNSCCQFEGFRKLSVERGKFVASGWLDPLEDSKEEDKGLWTPVLDHVEALPSPEVCKFILKYVGPEFCALIKEEMCAQAQYPSNRIWKRMQEKVREMCDVCSTTLFNTHYTCGECGILVCIDCFAVRSRGNVEYLSSNTLTKPYKSHRKILTKNRDEHMWPLCKGESKHLFSNLLCTQMICHGLMEELRESFHAVCEHIGIRDCCEEGSIKSIRKEDHSYSMGVEVVEPLQPLRSSWVSIPNTNKSDPSFTPLENVVKEEEVNVSESVPTEEEESSLADTNEVVDRLSTSVEMEQMNDPPLSCVRKENEEGETSSDSSKMELYDEKESFLENEEESSLEKERRIYLHDGADVKMEEPPMLEVKSKSEDSVVESSDPSIFSLKKEECLTDDDEDKKDIKFGGGSSYRQCPICFTHFPSAIPTLGHIHLTRHFEDEIRSTLSPENRSACPICSQVFDKEDLVILHVGIEHGVTNQKLANWKKKRSNKVQLNVDSAINCIVCGMNFGHHMMGFPQIRSHLFMHFRSIIRSRFKLEGHCPICPTDPSETSKSISSLTQHIGIHHRYLDVCWSEHSKQGTPDESEEESDNEEPRVKEEGGGEGEDNASNASDKTYCSVILAFSCEICGARLPNQSSLYKHSALSHFRHDLRAFISRSGDCLLCTNHSPFPSEEDSLLHVGLAHEKIQKLLNNEVSILNKALRSDEESFSYCPVCKEEGDFDFAHFSLHFSIPSHQSLLKRDGKLKKILRKMSMHCLICEKKLRPSRFLGHYYTHFKKTVALRYSPGCICHLCPEAPAFLSFLEFEIHYKKDHFSAYLEDQLGPIRSLEDIIWLRKNLSSRNDPSFKRLKRSCDYCMKGYYEGEYYEHMSLEHFREVLQVGLPDSPPFQCDRCSFLGERLSELVVHSAEYHKNLDRILNQICPSFNISVEQPSQLDLRSFSSTQHLSESTQIFTCKKCEFMTMNEAILNRHIVQHIRDISKSFIGCKRPPYICPKCQYEASSYISLLRHFCTSHTRLLERNSSNSRTPVEKQLSPGAEASKHPRQVVSFTYKENRGPSPNNSPIKNTRKSTFMSLIQDLQQNESQRSSSKIHIRSTPPRRTKDLSREKRVMTKSLSSKLYPGVDHAWYCDGRLLFLKDPSCPGNKRLFQDQWKRGQPVLVGNCSRGLSKQFWHPRAFLEDFGHLRHDLVNCFSGKTVPNAPLDDFWRGFERVEERLRDSSGNPMLLKLKDWPPTLDIADYIPKRFSEFINSLIFPEYTQRQGYLNLASYIPKFFLRPELGPKMYIAYGSALYSDKGSTNLHIDMSDAVNLLVHVGIPFDADPTEIAKEVFKEIDEADCDIMMKWRVREKDVLPGALWHIYHPSDTNKIRSFLNKVALGKGKRLDPHDDPIHDQSNYLDGPLRLRLYEEYGVKGYGIVQCAGDTVFIPAGACHQVRNLNNCIKIAEDFVSPENTSHCLHLTQEFRHLTEFHTNHEDKLQIKTLMYHSIKVAVTVLKDHLEKESEASESATPNINQHDANHQVKY